MNQQKSVLTLLVALLCCVFSIKAQNAGQVTGKVVDTMGELSGVSIVVKGSTNGTVTDLDGQFTLSNVKNSDVLVFSFIGYKTQEIKIGNKKVFNVTLVEDAQALEEVTVVAVGYGDVKKADLTGSIGSANIGDLMKTPVSNITESLGGRIAGVKVSSSDGGLGDNYSIIIRGAGSLTGSTAPLYVIDGFPQESSGLSSLDPNDIESIDVLKDASATAIYGARGANGVVIVTTKKGLAGKPTITYNGSMTIGKVKNTPAVMNGYEFVELQKEIMQDSDEFKSAYYTDLYPDLEAYRSAPSYDWQDYIYRTAVTHSHHVSLTGGQGDLKYSASLSYNDQQGVIINSGLKRYQGRFSISQKVNKRLKLDMSGNYASSVQDGPTPSTGTSAVSTAYMYSVWAFRPVSPKGTDLLNTMYDDGVNMAEDYRFNPVLSARNEYRHKTNNVLQYNASAEYEFIKGLKLKVSSSKGENTMMSYFGRVNYSYKSLYYLTATMRADGSSKFAKGHKWGYFPSGSFAWAFSREKFIEEKTSEWLSNGKLRLSYGLTGNNRIGNYDYMAKLVTSDDVYKYPWNGEFTNGYVLASMPNPLLKWETTEQYDFGVDLGFLNGRINLTMDYYVKTTKDLLLSADISASSGFSSATLNIGKLRNKGFEVTLETTNIKKKNFSWTSNINIAFNDNKILALNSGQEYMTSYISWDNKYKSMPAYISKVGESAGKMYGFVYEGTYKYEDFNTSVNEKGETVYKLKAGIPYYTANTQPGDPKYKNMDENLQINDADKVAIGNGQPKHTGGFTNNFTYKNFDLNIFMTWSYGNDILNANRMIFENPSSKQNTNMFATYVNRWTESNPYSDMPRAKAQGAGEYSSLYVEDGSFLKLKNITLGYNFKPKTLHPLHISSARVYVSAENIATISSYSGSDPEVSTRNSVLTPGFDWSAYPRAFNLSLGLNVTF